MPIVSGADAAHCLARLMAPSLVSSSEKGCSETPDAA